MSVSPQIDMDAGLRVVSIDPTSNARWTALMETDAAGVFHSPPWLRALTDAYGFDVQACIVVDAADRPQGGIPFCIPEDPFERRIISLPFTDACDPLLVDPGAWPVLFAHLQKFEAPLLMRCLRDATILADERFVVTKRARWHTLSTVPGSAALWVNIEGSARRAIRKAERAGVTIRPILGPDGLAEFHHLHMLLRKQKYHLLAQPVSFFQAIRKHFEQIDGWFPLGAFIGNKLIAGTIYLRWRNTLYYKFNASSLNALDVRPNNLLVWAGIQLAQSLGCHTLDLGPSDIDQPGLIRFKSNVGAEQRDLHFLRYDPATGSRGRGAELRSALGELTRLLTRPDVPDEVTGRAGEFLYRYFA